MRVLVTGATGFVGRALVPALVSRDGVVVRAALRSQDDRSASLESVVVGEVDSRTEWRVAIESVDVIVHLAARVHVMHDRAADSLAAFRRTNVSGSLRLAEQAASAGVRRLVYLSSIKVNGETGVFRETDAPSPEDPYGVSKCEAENGLRAIAARSGLEVVIIRPPLVYGPNVKGNFQWLMHAVARGVPLPLGAVHNSRSFVALDNLVDLIVTCIAHPAAVNQVFFVSDGEDISTTALITRLGLAMERRPRLIPVPAALLMLSAALLGKRAVANRLLGSLCVDISKARGVLGWTPYLTVDEGLKRAARGT